MGDIKYNKRIFRPFSTLDGCYFCAVSEGNKYKILSLDSQLFEMEYKTIHYKRKGEVLDNRHFDMILEKLKLDAYMNRLDYNLETRIFCGDGFVVYNLNMEESLSIWIEDGNVDIVETPEYVFKYDQTLKSNVTPNLKVKMTKLPRLLKKHFHLRSEEDILILTLYLVTAFAGNQISHFIIILMGSKGAGKSRCAKLISEIVNPQTVSSLGVVSKSRDDLAIRLSNSYLTILDNIVKLDKDFASILAISVSNGQYCKRALFRNTEEIKLNIRSLIILTGIDIASYGKSDLLDRSILLNLNRIAPDEVKTERELDMEFQKDLPEILGCCFKLLAKALADNKSVDVPKTRMADNFELMIKVGRALGFADEETAQILWSNQSEINHFTIADNMVATCVVALMEQRDEYIGAVTDLLRDLQDIAEEHLGDKSVLPKQPNVLSRRLNEIRSNLECEYGIRYNIHNTGNFREIHLYKINKE